MARDLAYTLNFCSYHNSNYDDCQVYMHGLALKQLHKFLGIKGYGPARLALC